MSDRPCSSESVVDLL